MTSLPDNFTVGIIGVGRLGGSLALHFAKIGRLLWTVSRSPLPAALSAIQRFASIADIPHFPDFCFLTVRDTAIASCAEQLLRHHRTAIAQRIVIHCSGALDIAVLSPLLAAGAQPAVLHPYQMFPIPDPALLEGISWSVECAPSVFPLLQELVRRMNGTAFLLTESQRKRKPIYHASAVAASNVLIAAIGLAQDLLQHCELPPERFLPPIVRTAKETALEQVYRQEPLLTRLTGPIARADISTLHLQLTALRDLPTLQQAYAHLALAITHLARHHRLISEEQFRQMVFVLQKALL